MTVWFDDDIRIDCGIDDVRRSVEDLGTHYAGVVGCLPGLTTVELVDQSSESVTIRTNEGTMRRTNISTSVDPLRVVIELDEEYEAGSKVTTRSHFRDEFTTDGSAVTLRVVISDVRADGFLGFLYRTFGGSRMGKAFLTANADHLQQRTSRA